MKQVVVFCESYPHIKYALYLIVRDYRHCSITVVIPSKHSLFKFFSLVNERLFHNKLDLVYFEVYQRRTTTRISKMKKAIYILPDIIYERKRLREIYSEYFSRFSNAEIYFFSRHFASYSYYLLNKLSGVNRLVFMPDEAWDIISMRRYTPTDIVSLVVLAMMKLTFN